jgi:peptide/nickel transport system substrate-binding protein
MEKRVWTPVLHGRRTRAPRSLIARFARALVFTAIVSFTLTAAGGGASGSSSAASASAGGGQVVSGSGGTVTIRSIDDLNTFNPILTSTNLAFEMVSLAYDNLVYLEPNGKLAPWLASSWTSTPNSATFKIGRGATCDDGTPVTPAVVANGLRYDFVKGPFNAFLVGPGKFKSVSYSNSADTVTVTLTKPYNGLVLGLSNVYAPIICPAGLANPNLMNSQPEGSGPYMYDASRSRRGSVYVFTLRKNYNWGPLGWTAKKPGIPSTIIERPVVDETTAANLFLTGTTDITPSFGINETRVAADKSAYTYNTSSLQMGSWGVVLNQAPGRVGADPAVRHAVFLALDGPTMVKAAFSNLGVPFATELTPNIECYNAAVGAATAGYNPAQAKQILEQDGYKMIGGVMTKNGKPLMLSIVMYGTQQLPEFIQSQLAKIGIKATVENTDIATWTTAVTSSHNYDLTVYSYYSDLPNPLIIPVQDAVLNIEDPTYFNLASKAEEAPASQACPAWDKALTRAEANYDVKPIGVARNEWFAKGWTFKAVLLVIIDPFTLERTR